MRSVLAIAVGFLALAQAAAFAEDGGNYKPRPLTPEEAEIKGRIVGLICEEAKSPGTYIRFVEANPGNNAIRVLMKGPNNPEEVRNRLYVEGSSVRIRSSMTQQWSFDSSYRWFTMTLPQGRVTVPCHR
jgi:hypothetical protein